MLFSARRHAEAPLFCMRGADIALPLLMLPLPLWMASLFSLADAIFELMPCRQPCRRCFADAAIIFRRFRHAIADVFFFFHFFAAPLMPLAAILRC